MMQLSTTTLFFLRPSSKQTHAKRLLVHHSLSLLLAAACSSSTNELRVFPSLPHGTEQTFQTSHQPRSTDSQRTVRSQPSASLSPCGRYLCLSLSHTLSLSRRPVFKGFVRCVWVVCGTDGVRSALCRAGEVGSDGHGLLGVARTLHGL